MVGTMCGVQLKNGKRANVLTLVLGLDETIDQMYAYINYGY